MVSNKLVAVVPIVFSIYGAYWFMKQRCSMKKFDKKKAEKRCSKKKFDKKKAEKRCSKKKFDRNKLEKVYFKDVAGCDEAKKEILEFVDLLNNPIKYKELGAKIPKGILLVGPSGTGKTLLTKVIACESGLPFISICGSEFRNMSFKVGSAKVKESFSKAKNMAPSVLLIDEIDEIGQVRGKRRKSILNQILVEMDGYTTSGVIVLAAIRPGILEDSLLRPGRFERKITISKPNARIRDEIFQVYLKKIKLDQEPTHYSKRLADLTPNFSGAQITNVCNEAALIAARNGNAEVTLKHFDAAIDWIGGGLEKRNTELSEKDREIVAYHESGHAVVSWFMEHAEPALTVSIVPNGKRLGCTDCFDISENHIKSREHYFQKMCIYLGGRLSEEILLGKKFNGCISDLEKVTKLAYRQVTVHGFSDEVGLISFPSLKELGYSNIPSDVYTEVKNLVVRAVDVTKNVIQEHKEQIVQIAKLLLVKEILHQEDLVSVLGERRFKSKDPAG